MAHNAPECVWPPGPAGKLKRSPDPVAATGGPTSNGNGGEGREKKGGKGRDRKRWERKGGEGTGPTLFYATPLPGSLRRKKYVPEVDQFGSVKEWLVGCGEMTW